MLSYDNGKTMTLRKSEDLQLPEYGMHNTETISIQ